MFYCHNAQYVGSAANHRWDSDSFTLSRLHHGSFSSHSMALTGPVDSSTGDTWTPRQKEPLTLLQIVKGTVCTSSVNLVASSGTDGWMMNGWMDGKKCFCYLRMSPLYLHRRRVLFHGARHVALPCLYSSPEWTTVETALESNVGNKTLPQCGTIKNHNC